MKAWNVWKKMQGITNEFIRLSSADIVIEEDFLEIQLPTLLIHDITSQIEPMNKCGRKRIEIYQMQPTGGRNRQIRNVMIRLNHFGNHFEPDSDEGSELISCRCKTMCIGNCKCNRFNLQCPALCTCDGQCSQ
ncbi:hypothetical protein JTB14_000528 [Gonioctena quinquepunctata]|nr:hypothetical protein JTB14_000528 [Gonioctena quinquepunctata]